MTARRWRAEFSAAASTFDWATVTRLSRKFVTALYASPTPHDAVDAVLLLLRENLRYEELEGGADAALAFGPGSPAVRRRYAQALVDGGNPAVAIPDQAKAVKAFRSLELLVTIEPLMYSGSGNL